MKYLFRSTLLFLGMHVLLLLTSCGSDSQHPKTTDILPPQSIGTISTRTLSASRSNLDNPGVVTTSQTTKVTLPQPSDIKVLMNSNEFYHASLTLGSVSCDYTHNIGDSAFSNGSGCTTADSSVTLTTGQQIILDVGNNNQTQFTSIQLTISLIN